ncbi:substrate-binding periplasmic protein [Marinobacter changyiensis]|uniref:substrate-binding periplasmic protein n=1 Tax=Marinobacter changyiensis TaxID=2604091 RepID=UPI0012649C60|nr:transporter substrate-binding domain-containing protein [Marinobacter changyiensis]
MCRTHRQYLSAIYLFGLLPGLLATLASAEPGLESYKPGGPGVFQLNVSPNGYPPYIIIEDDDQYSGIVWEVVKTVSERLNYKVQPKKIPRKRVDSMLLDGHIDGTPRAIEWTDNPDKYVFTDPVVRIREVFFTRKGEEFRYQQPSDLDSLTVVTHLGYRYPELAEIFESGKAKRFDVSQDRDLLSFLLNADHFHTAIADLSVGQWIIRENGWQDAFSYTENGISDFGFRLMLRKDWAGFAKDFNGELAQIRESGELDQILDRYR